MYYRCTTKFLFLFSLRYAAGHSRYSIFYKYNQLRTSVSIAPSFVTLQQAFNMLISIFQMVYAERNGFIGFSYKGSQKQREICLVKLRSSPNALRIATVRDKALLTNKGVRVSSQNMGFPSYYQILLWICCWQLTTTFDTGQVAAALRGLLFIPYICGEERFLRNFSYFLPFRDIPVSYQQHMYRFLTLLQQQLGYWRLQRGFKRFTISV